MTTLIPTQTVRSKIFLIRGKKVMLDKDLAMLYGVMTRNLNKAVKRNSKRFPKEFMFQLTDREFGLMFQIGTSKRGGTRKRPFVFSEHGILMLASVLNSDRAIETSIKIIKVFNELRELLTKHQDLKKRIEEIEKKYDKKFGDVDSKVHSVFKAFEEIKELLEPPADKLKNKVGFI